MGKIRDIINGVRAQKYYIRAHGSDSSFALHAILKAVELEPDIGKVPGYLELQGNMERNFGRKEKSTETFTRALDLMELHPDKFKNQSANKMRERILRAVEL